MGSYTVTDLSALQRNALTLQRQIGDMYCVVKCNAYGHGDTECVAALREVGMTRFAVFSVAEAIRIKNAAADAEILILGRSESKYTDVICRYGFVQTVGSAEYAHLLSAMPTRPRIHVKIDTGMNRSGFGSDDPSFISALHGIENNIVGAYTHFPNADLSDISDTEKRYLAFKEASAALEHELKRPLTLHAAASAAALRKELKKLRGSDLCRIGIALYGISPTKFQASDVSLTPVMSFYGTVSEVRRVRAGEHIGYGGKKLCTRDSFVATVSAGYANGLMRSLSGRFCPSLNGHRVPFAGNICMDRCMLDVTDMIEGGESVKSGDTVVFFDKTHPVTLISDSIDTISYEVLTTVGNLSAKRLTLP